MKRMPILLRILRAASPVTGPTFPEKSWLVQRPLAREHLVVSITTWVATNKISPNRLVTIVAAWVLTFGSTLHAQSTSQGHTGAQEFTLVQPGVQTIVLGRFPYEAQKAGRISCRLALGHGELAATCVVRMLASDGTDVSGRVKLLGGYEQTLEFPVAELRPGIFVPIVKDIVTATFTAAVSVELRVTVQQTPSTLRVDELSLRERRGEPIDSDDGAQLVTSPEVDFAYSQNLLPPMESPQWKPVGPAARRGRGPGGQAILALDEHGDGGWESPIIRLSNEAKELCLQTFVKFDAMATPYEHPFQVIFRSSEGAVIKPSLGRLGWPAWEWNLNYGQWIPLSIRFGIPDRAASAQLVMGLGRGFSATWQNKGEVTRNNFVTFQAAGLRLWASVEPSTAGISPYNFTAWAGGAANAGPFIPCKALQENSIALWTSVNDTGNLYFSKDRVWPLPKARLENLLPIHRSVELKGQIFDWTGRLISAVARSVKLAPYEVKTVELPVESIAQTGCYSLNLDAVQDGVLVGQGVIRWGNFCEPSDRADRRNLQYPFCFHPGVSAQGGGAGKYVDLELRTLRAMGVRGFRLQCRLWGLTGTNVDAAIASVREYSDNFHRQVWPYMEKYGFDGYVTFFPKPRSPIPESGSPEMAAWEQYVAAAVRLYPEISTFEFGNEEIGQSNKTVDERPEVWGYAGSMREYVREFKAARHAAITARPDVTFVVGQASDPTANVAKLFFEAGGTAKEVQGWAINSYVRSPDTWRNLSDTLRRNGVDLSKLVGLIPEIGYGVPRRGPKRLNAERGEAIKLVTNQVETLAAAPWIRDINWFTVVSRSAVVHNFVFDTDWSPKPMVGAYLTMSSTLGAGRPERVPSPPGTNVYLWRRPDRSQAGIVWALNGHELHLRVGETKGPVVVRDLMGNDTTIAPKDGVIPIKTSESPVYLMNIQTLVDGNAP